jgi:hypothetical protein
MTILASVKPDSFFEEFVRNDGSIISPHGATHQYFIAYSENHHDGTTVQRVATWRFVPSRGLMLGGEADLLEEISRVGAHILSAIYQGGHDEIEEHTGEAHGHGAPMTPAAPDASTAGTAQTSAAPQTCTASNDVDFTSRPTSRKSPRMTVGGYEKEKDEFYPTPAVLTRVLLENERFDGDIWEPACGDGAMSRVLSAAGHTVISTDLIDRGYGEAYIDFLKQDRLRAPNIVTNPPFGLWKEFAQHAHRLGARKIVLFNKLAIAGNQTHSQVMIKTGLARILIVVGRVNILPPGAVDKGMNARNGNYAWYVWERGNIGDPVMKWLAPEKPKKDVMSAKMARSLDWQASSSRRSASLPATP